MANEIEEEIGEAGFPTGTVLTIIGLILVIGLAGYFFIFKNRSTAPSPNEIAREVTTPMPARNITPSIFPKPTVRVVPPVVAPETGLRHTERVFEIHAADFTFSTPEIRVRSGEVVKILLVNDGGVHNIGIDEFNARTNTIEQGQVAEVTFLADRPGIFEFYCSIDDHRGFGMVGSLVVE